MWSQGHLEGGSSRGWGRLTPALPGQLTAGPTPLRMRIGEAGNRGLGQSATCNGFSPQQVLNEQVSKQESRGEGGHQLGMEEDGALPRESACLPQLHASALECPLPARQR